MRRAWNQLSNVGYRLVPVPAGMVLQCHKSVDGPPSDSRREAVMGRLAPLFDGGDVGNHDWLHIVSSWWFRCSRTGDDSITWASDRDYVRNHGIDRIAIRLDRYRTPGRWNRMASTVFGW